MRIRLALALALALGGCGGLGGSNPLSPSRVRIHLSSPAFSAGGPIPAQFTCQGHDVSPPLHISGVPHGARTLELVMKDPDAPGGNFIHWDLEGIPPATSKLGPGQIPAAAKVEKNDFGTLGYRGPCPPAGRAHRYVITVTAQTGADVLGVGTLTGTYARR
ncbi:MAG TPA: YbhB/YbcL family Raf kinase inhibitor-like protein [Solirubrobacteraceae bacterium]|nr:YbhB/YbcL family Raf kinase inhibitor-like protein [Solirubrobacteraceae bacterium]